VIHQARDLKEKIGNLGSELRELKEQLGKAGETTSNLHDYSCP
jgi:hypothetical protein